MVELHTPGLVEHIVVLFIVLLPLFLVITIVGILLKAIRSKSTSPTVKKITGYSLIVICSIFLVLTTLYFPKTINNPNQLKNILCGWPEPFIQFESSMNPPDGWTTSCIGWSGSPMDTKKEIIWGNFLVNIIFVFGGITLATFALRRVLKIKEVFYETIP